MLGRSVCLTTTQMSHQRLWFVKQFVQSQIILFPSFSSSEVKSHVKETSFQDVEKSKRMRRGGDLKLNLGILLRREKMLDKICDFRREEDLWLGRRWNAKLICFLVFFWKHPFRYSLIKPRKGSKWKRKNYEDDYSFWSTGFPAGFMLKVIYYYQKIESYIIFVYTQN